MEWYLPLRAPVPLRGGTRGRANEYEIRMIRPPAAALSVLLGAGAGAAALALGAGATPPKPVPLSRFVSRLTPAENKVALSDAELAALRGWARGVEACMTKIGICAGAPTVGHDEILIALPRVSKKERLQRAERSTRCVASVGGPPAHASFVIEHDGRIHLYRPRACLLPVVPAKT